MAHIGYLHPSPQPTLISLRYIEDSHELILFGLSAAHFAAEPFHSSHICPLIFNFDLPIMSSATFKPLSMADGCLTSLPTLFTTKSSYPFLSLPSKPLKLVPLTSSSSSPSWVSLKNKQSSSTIVPLVASTSDWAQQGEENQVKWENEEGDETEAAWEGGVESGEEEAEEADGLEEETEVESYPEPPEEAKLFVGNLSFDIDSEKLAGIFEQAGVVEVAEVIYNRDTEQSRGFGFVTMSTVEEAEKAVEMFNRYDVNGRLLTVNKAAPRGSRPERTPRAFGPALRLYVGNLPWGVDDALLEQLFSEYGKVVDARVVFDRESGRSRGFGFVTMATQSELDDAIAGLDGQSVEGRAIRVNVAEERPPRRSF